MSLSQDMPFATLVKNSSSENIKISDQEISPDTEYDYTALEDAESMLHSVTFEIYDKLCSQFIYPALGFLLILFGFSWVLMQNQISNMVLLWFQGSGLILCLLFLSSVYIMEIGINELLLNDFLQLLASEV